METLTTPMVAMRMAGSCGKLLTMEGSVTVRFYGKGNPMDQCPAVFVDFENIRFLFQGETVTDPGHAGGNHGAQPDAAHRVGRCSAPAHGGDHLGGSP